MYRIRIVCSDSGVGEGNGSLLQYSCLENPVDRGAWWAAVHGVPQNQTRLKRLSMHACIGEGNGSPLQYSCLENPRDRGAWWVSVHGVPQSRTRLKRLSSNSSSSLQWQVLWSQSLDPWSLCWKEVHKHSSVAEVALISLLRFLVTPQIHGNMKMWSSSESAHSWLTFTGCLNGNWSPSSVPTDSIRCHPFHRWELWGPRLPSCRTEFWSGWATSENPFLSTIVCLHFSWRGIYRNIHSYEIPSIIVNFSSTNTTEWMENCLGSKRRSPPTPNPRKGFMKLGRPE